MSDSEKIGLDIWIAENVMGWRMHVSGRGSVVATSDFNGPNECERIIEARHPWDNNEWNPTTDAAAAMEVLRKCLEKCHVTLGEDQSGGFFAMKASGLGRVHETHAETFPLAISKFAQALFSK